MKLSKYPFTVCLGKIQKDLTYRCALDIGGKSGYKAITLSHATPKLRVFPLAVYKHAVKIKEDTYIMSAHNHFDFTVQNYNFSDKNLLIVASLGISD